MTANAPRVGTECGRVVVEDEVHTLGLRHRGLVFGGSTASYEHSRVRHVHEPLESSTNHLTHAEFPKMPRPHMLTYVRDLGPGAFGLAKLYKTRSGDPVCVKEVHYPRDSETRKQVLNEVRSMESCVHPNVVTFLDSWVSGTRLCIMMEYCSGGDLSSYLAMHAPLGEIRVLQILTPLISALAFIHSPSARLVQMPRPSSGVMRGSVAFEVGAEWPTYGGTGVVPAAQVVMQTVT